MKRIILCILALMLLSTIGLITQVGGQNACYSDGCDELGCAGGQGACQANGTCCINCSPTPGDYCLDRGEDAAQQCPVS